VVENVFRPERRMPEKGKKSFNRLKKSGQDQSSSSYSKEGQKKEEYEAFRAIRESKKATPK